MKFLCIAKTVEEATDIGNAYLKAVTSEKLYIVAGPKFSRELEGHTLVIHKAL